MITRFRGVPTWRELVILAHRFTAGGVPTLIADPRDLEIVNGRLVVNQSPAAHREIDDFLRRLGQYR